jgi:predicted nucleic acid-binding protein
MTTYDQNKQQLPDLDEFENAKNSILQDMWRNAHKYTLTNKQVAFAERLWDEEKNGNSIYMQNMVELPDLDKFEHARNNILQDMWWKAKRYKLSDKQIDLARKLWNSEQLPQVELGDEMAKFLKWAAEMYLPSNYHNNTGYYISSIIYPKMEQADYDKVMKAFYKYRKSVLKKVFV